MNFIDGLLSVIVIQLLNAVCIGAIIYLMNRRLRWSLTGGWSYTMLVLVYGPAWTTPATAAGMTLTLCGVYLFLASCVYHFRNFFLWISSVLLFVAGFYFEPVFIIVLICACVAVWRSHYRAVKIQFTVVAVISAFVMLILRYIIFAGDIVSNSASDVSILGTVVMLFPFIVLSGIYIYLYKKTYRTQTGPMFIYVYLSSFVGMMVTNAVFSLRQELSGMLSALLIIAGASAAHEFSGRISEKTISYKINASLCIVSFVIIAQIIGCGLIWCYR